MPDQAGIDATRRSLDLAASAGPDDAVLVLLSGGGSANWIAPAGDLTLAEKQGITRALLRSGAPIDENQLRAQAPVADQGRAPRPRRPQCRLAPDPRHLRRAARRPAVIASGPTVPDPTTLADARAICERRGIALPPTAAALLAEGGNESPKPGDPLFAHAEFRIVARPIDALTAAATAARAAGYEPELLGADLEGEAREVAAEHAAIARARAAEGRRVALISGGELTVTIRGEGQGGPNQEYMLALAVASTGRRASPPCRPTPTAPTAAAARRPTRPARSSTRRRCRGRAPPGWTRRRAWTTTTRPRSSTGSATSCAPGPPAPTSMIAASSWLAEP